MKRFALLAFLAALCANNIALAAEEDSGLWATVAMSKVLAERVTAAMVFQLRLNDDVDRRERALLRPSLSYRVDPSQMLTLGYDAHFINTSNDKVEQRLWQQYQLSRQYSDISASLRLRLQQRFIDHVDGVPVRLRIKPALKIPFDNSPCFSRYRTNFLSPSTMLTVGSSMVTTRIVHTLVLAEHLARASQAKLVIRTSSLSGPGETR